MIETVAGKGVLHVGQDVSIHLWHRNVLTICGRFLGNAEPSKKGDKPSCRHCKSILAGML